jgi:hypothetical protein
MAYDLHVSVAAHCKLVIVALIKISRLSCLGKYWVFVGYCHLELISTLTRLTAF